MVQPVNDETALALTQLGEARSEGIEGMTAVGNTVMNRVRKKTWYGLTPLEVCLKHSRTHKPVYQYSCWNIGDPNRDYMVDLPSSDPLYFQSLKIATNLINNLLKDNTNGATHYYSGNEVPFWALGKMPCKTIGKLIFFNNID